MWQAKEPSLLNGHECRAWVKICSPSPAMVTSQYEWKILECDEKPQWNIQTNTNKKNLNWKLKILFKYHQNIWLRYYCITFIYSLHYFMDIWHIIYSKTFTLQISLPVLFKSFNFFFTGDWRRVGLIVEKATKYTFGHGFVPILL